MFLASLVWLLCDWNSFWIILAPTEPVVWFPTSTRPLWVRTLSAYGMVLEQRCPPNVLMLENIDLGFLVLAQRCQECALVPGPFLV